MLREAIRKFPHAQGVAERLDLSVTRESVLVALGFARSDAWPRDLWEADHIVPVEKGGGLCGLDGMQTLCAPCHRKKTAVDRRHG